MELFDESIYSVSQITGEIKELLEVEFSNIAVLGEISNFKNHVSGHWYFTLKDSNAAISCTMWRSLNSKVAFTPEDGMKVIVKGRITVYPPRGNYQIDVRSMKPAGEGELQAAFERMKKRLSAEGLFDVEHKKSLPLFPRKIGVVTAIDGAAFQDMINTATRRFPLAELIISPARVQGEGAAESIAKGIRKLNKLGDVDVIIIGRGGGSLEDLWAFNEEVVARAIFDSDVPVISGVGHEIDYTISDFVADVRAATPTAAMELATPSKEDILSYLVEFIENAHSHVYDLIENGKDQVRNILNSYGFKYPLNIVMNKSQFLDNLWFRLDKNMESKLIFERNRLDRLSAIIEANNSERILKKGYTLVKQNGKVVPRKDLIAENELQIQFYDGEIEVTKND